MRSDEVLELRQHFGQPDYFLSLATVGLGSPAAPAQDRRAGADRPGPWPPN
jgi:hypothetical protein